MKKLKKIAAVLASSVLLTSTMAFGMAASYPQPFVNNGAADVALVWGGSDTAATTDLAAVTDISTSLSGELTTQSTGPATVTGGDFIKLERGSDYFNLGDNMAQFYSVLDDDELSAILAEGTYKNSDNNEYEYTQDLVLNSKINLTHFADTEYNDEEPTVGFNFGSNALIANYTLDFRQNPETGADWGKIDDRDITLLGKTYYILSATNSSTGPKLTLLDSANSVVLSEGTTETVTVGDESYDVSINFINSNSVKLDIDGTVTESLNAGETEKLDGEVYVGVKEINVQDYAGGQKQVVFSIGSGKLIIENGQEVEINGDPVSDIVDNDHIITAYISTASDGDLDKINLEWKTNDDDVFLTPDTALVMPGFEAIKISMNGLVTGDGEETKLEASGDSRIQVSTEIKDGPVSINLLYLNATNTGFAGLGRSSSNKLVTNVSTSPTLRLNTSEDSYFVATWINGDEGESYVFEIDSISEKDSSTRNETKFSNKVKTETLTISEVNDNDNIGSQIKLTVTSIDSDGKLAVVTLQPQSSGTVYADRVVTKTGLMFKLPVLPATNVASSADGEIFIANATDSSDATWDMNFTEEDTDGNIEKGTDSFKARISLDGNDGPEPDVSYTGSGVTVYETEDGSNAYIGYVESALTTMVEQTKPSNGLNELTVSYFGEEVSAEVFVTESGASVITDGEVSVMTVTDSEASTVSSKNLIVVGGSCVNSVAADLLGVSAGTCGDAWEAATGVGSGSFLIETFSRSGGKVATLVAGYNAGDTTNAAQYLTTQDVDTGVGMKYTGTTATEATLVTS